MHDVAVRSRGSESAAETDEAAAWAGSAPHIHYVSCVQVSFLPWQQDSGVTPRPSEGFKFKFSTLKQQGRADNYLSADS